MEKPSTNYRQRFFDLGNKINELKPLLGNTILDIENFIKNLDLKKIDSLDEEKVKIIDGLINDYSTAVLNLIEDIRISNQILKETEEEIKKII